MALTVDQAVASVVGRLAGKLVFAGLSVLTDATNPDVTPAVGDALWYFGLTAADYPTLADSDLSTLTEPKRFVDAATLETLYRIQGSIVLVDMRVDKNEQKLSQFRDDIAAMIKAYQARVPDPNFPRPAVGQLAAPSSLPSPYPRPGCVDPLEFDRGWGNWGYPWA